MRVSVLAIVVVLIHALVCVGGLTRPSLDPASSKHKYAVILTAIENKQKTNELLATARQVLACVDRSSVDVIIRVSTDDLTRLQNYPEVVDGRILLQDISLDMIGVLRLCNTCSYELIMHLDDHIWPLRSVGELFREYRGSDFTMSPEKGVVLLKPSSLLFEAVCQYYELNMETLANLDLHEILVKFFSSTATYSTHKLPPCTVAGENIHCFSNSSLFVHKASIHESSSSLAVLGPHHSGTSVLMAMLRSLDVWIGAEDELMMLAGNPLKYLELEKVVNINQKLFEQQWPEGEKGAWVGYNFDMNEVAIDTLEAVRRSAALVMEKLRSDANGQIYAVKDPRMCLTWDLWQPIMQPKPIALVTLKCPFVYEQRMNSRYQFTGGNPWLDIWTKYYLTALKSLVSQQTTAYFIRTDKVNIAQIQTFLLANYGILDTKIQPVLHGYVTPSIVKRVMNPTEQCVVQQGTQCDDLGRLYDNMWLLSEAFPVTYKNAASLALRKPSKPCDSDDDDDDGLRVFFVWTTSQKTFGPLQHRVLQSVYVHHPDACVYIYANHLDINAFGMYVDAGYALTIVKYDLHELMASTSALEGFTLPQSQYYYSHATDIMRILLLQKYGGLYMDFDFILISQIHLLKNTLGEQYTPNEPDFVKGGINGAFLLFDANHPFLQAVLDDIPKVYDKTVWGCIGPYLITSIARQYTDSITILPSEMLYPIRGSKFRQCFVENGCLDIWDKMKQVKSYAFHWFNTALATCTECDMPPTAHNSLPYLVFNSYCGEWCA